MGGESQKAKELTISAQGQLVVCGTALQGSEKPVDGVPRDMV